MPPRLLKSKVRKSNVVRSKVKRVKSSRVKRVKSSRVKRVKSSRVKRVSGIRRSKVRTSISSRKPRGLKLVYIKKSTRPDKKMMALFTDGTLTHFGAAGMSDFTKHKDSERKERYIKRHKSRENWRDPRTAGALSLFVLWNKQSLKESIADFKRRIKL